MATMCELSKMYIGKDNLKYISYLDKPKFMCGKCGRVANSDENLCRPILLEKAVELPQEIVNLKTTQIKNEINKDNIEIENTKIKKLKVNEFREIIREELKDIINNL